MGWAAYEKEVRWEVGVGGKLKAGLNKHSYTNSSAMHMPLVGDLDWDNSHGRQGLLLESVWHFMQSY